MRLLRAMARATALGIGIGAATYAAVAAVTWARFGSPRRRGEPDTLDRFLPEPEVVERHQIQVAAPGWATYAAACEMDLRRSPVVRAIIGARKLALGGLRAAHEQPLSAAQGLVAQSKSIGWGILWETPGHETVMGAVTQPWVANPVFRALSADEFAAFREPGWVKIAWNIRAEPVADGTSVFITETRARATDAAASSKFRLYWSLVLPGVWSIRRLMLRPLKRDAERRYRSLQLVNGDAAE